MNGRKAKQLRKEQKPKKKQFNNPTLVEFKGKSVYVPRALRRKILRQYKRDLEKGRITMDDIKRSTERDWKI